MVEIVPLRPLPSQTVTVTLANQSCRIDVYQKSFGLYMDLYVSDVLIVGGVLCQNLNRIVRSIYLGFVGDFCFLDDQGDASPDYTGLGSRFNLAYLSADELPAGQG